MNNKTHVVRACYMLNIVELYGHPDRAPPSGSAPPPSGPMSRGDRPPVGRLLPRGRPSPGSPRDPPPLTFANCTSCLCTHVLFGTGLMAKGYLAERVADPPGKTYPHPRGGRGFPGAWPDERPLAAMASIGDSTAVRPTPTSLASPCEPRRDR